MRKADNPGGRSTNVSADGPNGTKSSQPTAAAATTQRRKTPSRNLAAPEPLFLVFFALRLTIRLVSIPQSLRTRFVPSGTLYLLIVSGGWRRCLSDAL